MEILKQFDNKLLNRQEIIVKLESQATPSKLDVKKSLSEKFKSPEEQIVIEHIYGKFGSQVFTIEAKIYDSIESLSKYETVTKKERKKREEEAKKAAEEAKKAKEEAAKAEAEAKEQEKESSNSEENSEQTPEPKESEEKQEVSKPKEEPQESSESVEEKSAPEKEPKEESKSE
jgi:ribosomal protein S24E